MLNRKLLRDFRRLWTQAVAIALVAAAGVMTLLVGVGTYQALSDTRAAFYDRYSFADVFALASRVPDSVRERIEAIPGVARLDTRIQESVVLDIADMAEPATGLFLSLPDRGEPALNRLVVEEGRLPEAGAAGEIAISKAFAEAHDFHPGDGFSAIMGGVKRELTVTGIVLSPEFVYSIGSNGLFPDDLRFGIMWMRYSDIASAFDLTGAFNSVTLQLGTHANETAVIEQLDDILKPYGGQGAYGRGRQTSDAYLESEIVGLEAMNYILPPIFLGVAAFLMNMTLGRLVALEREQIGLLKSLGYRSATIAWHYMKFSLLIAVVGTVLGWFFGTWAARWLATIYAEFFKFPFLLFQDRPAAFFISAFAALLAAGLGSLQAVRSVVGLSPAVAMRPPAPKVYRQFFLDRLGVTRLLPQGLTMAVRNLIRQPLRAILTIAGISFSGALLVAGMFSEDAMDYMIDASFFQTQRQHATMTFSTPVRPTDLEDIKRLPGVMLVEPYRSVPVELRNGLHDYTLGLVGKPADADLSRVVDKDFNAQVLPEFGIALTDMLADILEVKIGDVVEVELLDGSEKTFSEPVTLIVEQYVGLGAYMDISHLNRLLGEDELASGVYATMDPLKADALYQEVKALPAIAGLTLQRKSLELLRATMGENLAISRVVYITIAVVIIFGVAYNSVRIQLSEQARELASLRVLGFTKAEVSVILLTELAILTAASVPLSWFLGYGIAYSVSIGMESELYRFPAYITRATYAEATLVVLGAIAASGAIVQRRIAHLDMIAVLKTRE